MSVLLRGGGGVGVFNPPPPGRKIAQLFFSKLPSISAFKIFLEFKADKLRMGSLWSYCCGAESEGIATEPLLSNPEVYVPSNLAVDQYNNPGNTSTHNGSGDGPDRNGSLRQIG